MNRWRCCSESLLHNIALALSGHQTSRLILQRGHPDFRSQQYLVAGMPHCTCSSPNLHSEQSPWLITMTTAAPAFSPWERMLCLWCHKTKVFLSIYQVHSQRTDIWLCLSGAQAPRGLLAGLASQSGRMGSELLIEASHNLWAGPAVLQGWAWRGCLCVLVWCSDIKVALAAATE